MTLVTLKKRAEFLRLRGGARCASASFVLETKARTDRPADVPVAPLPAPGGEAAPPSLAGPRFGFTVTKQLGKAVRRNRIRRRLKAAVTALQASHARAGFDYVLIARDSAFDRPFPELKKELEAAFHRVHHAPERQRPRRPRR